VCSKVQLSIPGANEREVCRAIAPTKIVQPGLLTRATTPTRVHQTIAALLLTLVDGVNEVLHCPGLVPNGTRVMVRGGDVRDAIISAHLVKVAAELLQRSNTLCLGKVAVITPLKLPWMHAWLRIVPVDRLRMPGF
jgi:hypothetical protein